MASYKDYKTVAAAQKAGSMYFVGKDGKKKLAVTKEQLDAWKKKNKGKYKGSALTAWANAKGKDIKGGRDSSPRPKLRPTKDQPKPSATRQEAEAKKSDTGDKSAVASGGKTVAAIKNTAEKAISRAERAAAKYEEDRKASEKRRGPSTGQKFNAWYKKNGDKYDTMKEAMEAYQGTLKSGMSYGGMAKKKTMGMNKGGMANCGASMKPNRMSRT